MTIVNTASYVWTLVREKILNSITTKKGDYMIEANAKGDHFAIYKCMWYIVYNVNPHIMYLKLI